MPTSSLPKPNEQFPAFSLSAVVPAADGSRQEKVLSDADFSDSRWVLFIYPKDATPGCTIEANEFAREYAKFQKHNIKVVGLSRDKLRAHHKFIEAQNLPYPLLSDADQDFLRQLDVIKNATMYGKPVTKVARTTFVMDTGNRILQVFEDVTPAGHAQQVLDCYAAE